MDSKTFRRKIAKSNCIRNIRRRCTTGISNLGGVVGICHIVLTSVFTFLIAILLLGIVLLVLELQGHYQVQAAEPIYIEHIEPTVEVAPTEEIIIITATEPSPEYIEELKTEYPDVVEEVPTQVSLGTFTLTAYCNCTKCCGKWAKYHQTALGTRPQKNHTIAVDPNVIPLGTTVVINGNEYVAEDTGSGVDGNHIDIFFESHQEALNFGKQKAEVFRYE